MISARREQEDEDRKRHQGQRPDRSCPQDDGLLEAALADLLRHANHHHVGQRAGDELRHRELQTSHGVYGERSGTEAVGDGVIVIAAGERLDQGRGGEGQRIGQLLAVQHDLRPQLAHELVPEADDGQASRTAAKATAPSSRCPADARGEQAGAWRRPARRRRSRRTRSPTRSDAARSSPSPTRRREASGGPRPRAAATAGQVPGCRARRPRTAPPPHSTASAARPAAASDSIVLATYRPAFRGA